MAQLTKKAVMQDDSVVTNYLTIDVEEYFQVAAFEKIISPNDWENHESRVVRNTRLILDLLERYRVKATFFIVGWTAERQPELVREVADRGHEIGCHSYLHRKIYDLSKDEFRADTRKAKEILEAVIGKEVVGYRAPSYSITRSSLWAFDILEEQGFSYDSSIFPIIHDNYGIPDAPRFVYKLQCHNMMEYPISTLLILGKTIPVSGGGYFRLFPYWFTRMALKRINRVEKMPFVFYLHPWEIDPGQPRINSAGRLSRFRHYNNLDKTMERFQNLLTEFNFSSISTDFS